MSHYKASIALHEAHQGKIEMTTRVPLATRDDLSLAYSPGVAGPCLDIAEHPERVWETTMKGRTVAVVTDGTAVLGLGDIGPAAALPVMEGKCALFKQFAGVDAVPICLDTQDVDEIVSIVKALAPAYGGINLEDIAAPRCFEIEERLKEELDIPVMHDDQHGTAIVTLAGLINALTVRGSTKENVSVVIAGAGAAGVAIMHMLHAYGITEIVMCDRGGIIHADRGDLTDVKKHIASETNPQDKTGSLAEAMRGSDVFIGVSSAGLVTRDMLASMAENPIVFAMANPDPEIMPDDAHEAGALIVATGRSDFPNQINNVLAFPGIFAGALRARARLTDASFVRAAEAIAACVSAPSADEVVPDPFDVRVSRAVQDAVYDALTT